MLKDVVCRKSFVLQICVKYLKTKIYVENENTNNLRPHVYMNFVA